MSCNIRLGSRFANRSMVTVEAFSKPQPVLCSAPLQQEQRRNFLALLNEHTTFPSHYFLSPALSIRCRLLFNSKITSGLASSRRGRSFMPLVRTLMIRITLLGSLVWSNALGQSLTDQPTIWSKKPGVADFEKIENDRLASAQRAIQQITSVKSTHTIENTLVPFDETTRL